ncbi:rab escort protein 1 [Impatiens glandulifera]|uniref:rab escort protein 1 n=1 Tax=Impatiens glandulifera TaxID=253017 RepID=UPI001FB172B8|nr:rab escort protein 1 [Impatiens glandulifera]
MDEEGNSYASIEPTSFDLIIVGTGLPESVLAAAAATNGRTVLHLDPNPYYGSHFTSLPLDELTSFLRSQSIHHSIPTSSSTDGDYLSVDLAIRPLYSDVEISSHSVEAVEHSRKFNLDVSGPKVLFCADSAVNLLLKSGISQYVEFKSIGSSFISDGSGKLFNVPDSRSAIFKDTSLGLTEKTRLGKFFKLVEEHLKAVRSDGVETNESTRISPEDLESPFVEFMNKMRLPPKIKSIILYAIAMTDYDQDNVETCEDVLKTKDGIERLSLYHSSVGRFSNALGALIYPMYAQGELSQAFCRRAAVKGCLYVLRTPVSALLIDKETGSYKGVKVATGQELFSQNLILGPLYRVSSSPYTSFPENLQQVLKKLDLRDTGKKKKVARAIFITKSSLKPDVSTFLVVYPPKTLYPEQSTSIRLLQIDSSLAVCPPGMFVSYISALCDDGVEGKILLNAAMNTVISSPNSVNPETDSTDESEKAKGLPSSIWSALYIQEMTMGSFEFICSTPGPDGKLNYNDLLGETEELFRKMFPNEEFFPETTDTQSETNDDDNDDDQTASEELVDNGTTSSDVKS